MARTFWCDIFRHYAAYILKIYYDIFSRRYDESPPSRLSKTSRQAFSFSSFLLLLQVIYFAMSDIIYDEMPAHARLFLREVAEVFTLLFLRYFRFLRYARLPHL